jgi:glucose/mannose transport system substrate-binding protein
MRRASRTILAVALGVGASLGGIACRSAGVDRAGTAGRAQPRQLVELFSWWTAPGEAEALAALVDAHRVTHPDSRIFNAAAASGAKAKERLSERFAQNDPPDLFQEYVHDHRIIANESTGKRGSLDELFDRDGLRGAIFPELLRDVSAGGHIWAMPVNVHRENTLFYNRKIFAAHHLKPPATLADFLATCRTLKAAGVTPVATAHQGWILRIMFQSLAMGSMGSRRYHDYFTGKETADLPLLRQAIDVFADVVENYANVDAGDDGFSWTSAAQAVYNGDAAMFLHGDWAKGYFSALGWSAESDFGAVGAPGASELFLYGVDAFALPTGSRNEPGARDFLATIASVQGQVAFNRLKGSSPIRRDVPRGDLDAEGRATLDDLDHAQIRMLVRSRPAWEDAFQAFAVNHDRAALLKAFIDAPPDA